MTRIEGFARSCQVHGYALVCFWCVGCVFADCAWDLLCCMAGHGQ